MKPTTAKRPRLATAAATATSERGSRSGSPQNVANVRVTLLRPPLRRDELVEAARHRDVDPFVVQPILVERHHPVDRIAQHGHEVRVVHEIPVPVPVTEVTEDDRRDAWSAARRATAASRNVQLSAIASAGAELGSLTIELEDLRALAHAGDAHRESDAHRSASALHHVEEDHRRPRRRFGLILAVRRPFCSSRAWSTPPPVPRSRRSPRPRAGRAARPTSGRSGLRSGAARRSRPAARGSRGATRPSSEPRGRCGRAPSAHAVVRSRGRQRSVIAVVWWWWSSFSVAWWSSSSKA